MNDRSLQTCPISSSDSFRLWEYFYSQDSRRSISGVGESQHESPTHLTGMLTPHFVNNMDLALAQGEWKVGLEEDCNPCYLHKSNLKGLEKQLEVGKEFLRFDDAHLHVIEASLESIRDELTGWFSSPWRVVNARCWRLNANTVHIGANTWHTDGFPRCISKMLIYLTGAGKQIGTTELLLPDGTILSVEGAPGTWFIFRNSKLLHRTIAPERLIKTQTVIELTLAPAGKHDLRPFDAGTNAMYPVLPWLSRETHPSAADWARAKEILTRFRWGDRARTVCSRILNAPRGMLRRFARIINQFLPTRFLNLGGGCGFRHAGWENLDSAAPSGTQQHFRFSPACSLPFPENRFDLVYSSHMLEHLDNETAERVLTESRRVLRSSGNLVIKIPDFDRALKAWQRGELAYFLNSVWDHRSVVATWANRGVCDTLHNRAAMVFCGFWTPEYGDHFANVRNHDRQAAYHGPPVVSESFLNTLVNDNNDPNAISVALKKVVLQTELNPIFNHQNAWGQEQFVKLLQQSGYRVLPLDKNAIITRFRAVPGIQDLKQVSAYFAAEKA